MVSVSSPTNAMTFDLYVQGRKTLDARDLLSSREIGFFPPQIQNIVADVLTADERLQKEFKQNYKALEAEYGKPKDKADEVALNAGALFATIVTNREKFPPEPFTILVDIGGGKTKKLEIKDASMYAGITFKRQQAERLEKYIDGVQAKAAQEALDNSHTVTPAMGALGNLLSIITMQKAKAKGEGETAAGAAGPDKAGAAGADTPAPNGPDLKEQQKTLVDFVRDFADTVRRAYQET